MSFDNVTTSDDVRASVVLVHGLWLNALALYPLEMRIKQCGFNVKQFGYPTVRVGLEENAARLSRFIDAIDADMVHLIAHSLGGLVTMRALQLRVHPRVRRVVLLGSPIAGSVSGRRLAQVEAGRAILGKSSRIWHLRTPAQVPDGVEVGVIAGNRPFGLGQLVGRLPRPHDGTVTVAETEVENATDSIVLRVTHTEMLFSRKVARQACSFLHDARFVRDALVD